MRRITSTDADVRMPPEATNKVCRRSKWRSSSVDREGRRVPAALGVHPAAAAGRPEVTIDRRARERHRSVRARAPRARGARLSAGGRQRDVDQPRQADADRLAADAREVDAFVADTARRLRAARRSAARLARLRRAHGRLLARPRALQRDATASSTIITTACSGRSATGSSARSPATCRSTSSPPGSSPATCCRTRRASRCSRRRSCASASARPRTARSTRSTRSSTWSSARQRDRHRVPRADGRLRPLPRSQVRPDQAERLLLARRVLQQQRRARRLCARLQRHPGRADAAVARRRDGSGAREAPRPKSPRASADYRRRARRRANAARTAPKRSPPTATSAAATVRASLADALVAHYAFESARPAALTELPPPRPPRIPPPALTEFRRNPFSGPPPSPNETAEQRRQREAFELVGRVPRNYNAESLTLSPAATPGVAPAVIQGAIVPAPACGAKRCSSTRRTAASSGATSATTIARMRSRSTSGSTSARLRERARAEPPAPSRTRAARAIGSRSTTASSGHRSRTRRPRT